MENQGNPIRRNDKVWLKTYEKLGIQYDITMPAANTSLIDILEKTLLPMLAKQHLCVWMSNCPMKN